MRIKLEGAAMRYMGPAYVSSVSKAHITAPQHRCPLHLNGYQREWRWHFNPVVVVLLQEGSAPCNRDPNVGPT
jgi:hypothetical protein